MSRVVVLITITDGGDNYDTRRFFEVAVLRLRRKRIFSLSCGIGRVDVDHEGLAQLARATGGLHIAVLDSEGIARALADLTEFIHVRVASVTRQKSTNEEGVIQHATIASAAGARIAVDAILLIDCSWSMFGMRDENNWCGDKQKIVQAKESGCRLINSLNPQFDRVGVARFWGDYQILCPLTNDFERCTRCIRDIEGAPGTGLYRAIAVIADAL